MFSSICEIYFITCSFDNKWKPKKSINLIYFFNILFIVSNKWEIKSLGWVERLGPGLGSQKWCWLAVYMIALLFARDLSLQRIIFGKKFLYYAGITNAGRKFLICGSFDCGAEISKCLVIENLHFAKSLVIDVANFSWRKEL